MTTTAIALPGTDARGALALFLRGHSPRTLRTYRSSLDAFARHRGASTAADAVGEMIRRGAGGAAAIAADFRAAMIEAGQSASTVNTRLTALRSLFTTLRRFGVVAWDLDVPGVRARSYRDTRGPSAAAVRALLAVAASDDSEVGRRNYALLRLLTDLALRRSEAAELDLAHVDLDAATVLVRSKGHSDREPMSLPEPTVAALRAWIEVRGTEPGALIRSLDRRGGGRITGRSIARLVRSMGDNAGIAGLAPHRLRHAAITHALNLTGGDVRAVQRFSRHADVRTVTIYDDNRQDLAGEVASQVAAW